MKKQDCFMIRLNRKALILSIILLCIMFSSKLMAQNLFNEENSAAYANYLFQAQEYELATQEYERLIFLNPGRIDYKVKLATTYKLNRKYSIGVQRINLLFPKQDEMPASVASEYTKMLLFDRQFEKAKAFIQETDSVRSKYIYKISLELLQANWKDAFHLAESFSDHHNIIIEDLKRISIEGQNLKRKSPFLAAGMSTFIPGSGKVYSNQWKDGLIAFVFVTGNAWQSYRGFKNDGIKSPYGWIFGTLAFGFYSGNIYGSAKAAKNYNLKKNNDLISKTEHFLIDQF